MNNIKIEVITEEECNSIYSFLKTSFFPHEPIVCQEPPLTQECTICLKGICQALSLKAVDLQGNTVGIALNMDMSALPKKRNTLGLAGLLSEFFTYCDQKGGVEKLEGYCTLQVLCVHPDWRKRGIGKMLASESEKIAFRNGFRGMDTVCTSCFSTKILTDIGWTETFSQRYSEYQNSDGQPVFKPPPPHDTFTVLVKHFEKS